MTSVNPENLRKLYESWSDDTLREFAVYEANELVPEAKAIFDAVIEARKLDEQVGIGLSAQAEHLSEEDLIELLAVLQNQPCPSCGQKAGPLYGSVVYKHIGLIFVSVADPEFKIACSGCLNEKLGRAMITTFFLGWWAIPHGLYKTPMYLTRNWNRKQYLSRQEVHPELHHFVLGNAPMLAMHRNDPAAIQDLLRGYR
ncbi:MAG: hypothetical protein EP332_02580 [Bacteroidetes bacterium]|nr:MAG: hypothetical protein EP332_02580 [Bacteroidota bacterium]